MARLHDTIERLHVAPDPPVRRLQQELRGLLETDADDEPALDLDVAAARQVQLAVYAEQSARKPVSAALGEARVKAFEYLEARPA